MEDAGICFQAFVPMRREPDERSEMTSQVIYGESFTILETNNKKKFSLIQLDHDNYKGWIDSKTIYLFSGSEKASFLSGNAEVTHDAFTILTSQNGSYPLIIGCGSSLRIRDGKVSDLTGWNYSQPENQTNSISESTRNNLVEFSKKLPGIPYLWGGRTSFGFDCSGLCQNLYKQVGINIPRDSGSQSTQGRTISFIEEAQIGDLAFFDNEEGDIIHAGMIFDKKLILHSSGKVKIDKIDHQGIYSAEQNRYTHRLRLIKNFID